MFVRRGIKGRKLLGGCMVGITFQIAKSCLVVKSVIS